MAGALTPVEVEAGTNGTTNGTTKRQFTMRDRAVTITLEDVSYWVKDTRKGPEKGKPLALLSGVSGYFQPGQMNALLGPSGSGKTTLLDVLAGRKTVGTLDGSIRFAGLKPTPEYLRRYTGYVEQFDTLLPILTPYEMLMYTAELKRPISEPLCSKQDAVEELLAKLALDVCRNVKIGSQMARGISGGQAKRVNVAIALITNPKVLFLDEPTTGLDSFTANEVMVAVQAIVRESGVTSVATIHSPTAFTFSLFDTVMMLVGGRTVYFGPQGPPALDYFQRAAPHVKAYEEGYNDAEYLIDLITEADRFGRGGEFADTYAASSLAADCKAKLADIQASTAQVPEEVIRDLQVTKATATPMWWALRTFIKYRTKKNYQDPAFLAPRIFDKLIISILIMTLYLGVGKDFSVDNIINVSAILFMWSATTGFIAAGYVPALVLERGLYIRERADGLYSPLTYLLARMLDELIINAIASLGIAAMTFYGVRLQGEFVLFWITWYTAVCTGIVLAYSVASWAPNMDVANAVVPLYGVTLLFFSGFLIRLDDLPPWWKWYSYLCWSRYAWGANMINQFESNDVQYLNGLTVLQFYGFDGVKSKWTNVGFVALFFLFFFTVTWAVLKFKNYARR